MFFLPRYDIQRVNCRCLILTNKSIVESPRVGVGELRQKSKLDDKHRTTMRTDLGRCISYITYILSGVLTCVGLYLKVPFARETGLDVA